MRRVCRPATATAIIIGRQRQRLLPTTILSVLLLLQLLHVEASLEDLDGSHRVLNGVGGHRGAGLSLTVSLAATIKMDAEGRSVQE